MKLLTIETTGKLSGTAYYEAGHEIIERKGPMGENHLISLMPMIKEILMDADICLSDLDGIGVSTGPGSYTGIRIGVSTARALSQVSKVPLIEIPTLYTFNYNEEQKKGVAVCPILDARRDQLYGACYLNREETIKPGAYNINEFLKMMKEEPSLKTVKFYGDGIFRFENIIKTELGETPLKFSFAQGEMVYQSPKSCMYVAKDKYEKGEIKNYEDVLPRYYRIAEAQQRLQEGTLGRKNRC